MAGDVCLTNAFVGTSLNFLVNFPGEEQEAIYFVGVVEERLKSIVGAGDKWAHRKSGWWW